MNAADWDERKQALRELGNWKLAQAVGENTAGVYVGELGEAALYGHVADGKDTEDTGADRGYIGS